MSRGVNDGFKVNTQSHLLPVLATSVKVIFYPCFITSYISDCSYSSFLYPNFVYSSEMGAGLFTSAFGISIVAF